MIRTLAILMCLLPNVGRAADIAWADTLPSGLVSAYPMRTMEPSTEGGPVDLSGPHLRIEGPIGDGDAERAEALLAERLPDPNVDMFNDVVVSLSSDGGDFYEGLALSDLFRRFAVGTYVGASDRCLSACAMAWLGGSNVLLRGLPLWPTRYLHETAIVGFHAPFTGLSEQYHGMDGADVDVGAVAEDFYEYARLAISEIAARIADWEVDSGFVFDMLSAGPPSLAEHEAKAEDLPTLAQNFVLIDTAARLDQVQGIRVGPAPGYPARLNAVDASHACAFVHVKNRQPGLQRGYGVNLWLKDPERTTNGPRPVLQAEQGFGAPTEILVPASGPDSYYFEGIETGLGPWQCNVFRIGNGWYVQTHNSNLHLRDPDTGKVRQDGLYGEIFDADAAYPVNGVIRLGWDMSWLAPRRDLYAHLPDLPERVAAVTKASFDCSGALDPAAEAICGDPALQRLDGAMVQLYLAARAIDPTQRALQRAWLKMRDARCRPGEVAAGDEVARATRDACLAAEMSQRIQELSRLVP